MRREIPLHVGAKSVPNRCFFGIAIFLVFQGLADESRSAGGSRRSARAGFR
jgi:hypothetical protein